MDKTSPSGSTPGDPVTRSRFEASPDPLLNRHSGSHNINLYAPGTLDQFRGPARIMDSAEDHSARAHGAINGGNQHFDHPARTRFAQAQAREAHVEFGSDRDGLSAAPASSEPVKSRLVALVFAVLFGAFGAHNFYLGLPHLGLRFLTVTFLGVVLTGLTGIALFLLMVPALLITEMMQISSDSGPYSAVNFHNGL